MKDTYNDMKLQSHQYYRSLAFAIALYIHNDILNYHYVAFDIIYQDDNTINFAHNIREVYNIQ